MKKTYQLIFFQSFFSIGLLIPILSLLLIEKGSNLAQIAIIFGVSSLTVFVLEVPSGMLADMIGRKTIFILSCALYFIASLSMLFINSFALMIPTIVFWGAGRALSSGSIDALIIDDFIDAHGTDNLSKVTSQLALLEITGLSTGAIIGGFLPTLSAGIFPDLGTYDLNLILRSFLCAASIPLTLFLVKDSRAHSHTKISFRNHALTSFRFIKKNKVVLLITLSLLCTGLFLSTVETYWQPAYSDITSSERLLWTLGLLSFGCFAFVALGNIISKRLLLTKQTGLPLKYTIMRLALFAGFIVFSLQRSVVGFSIFFFLIYFLLGGANIIESTMLNLAIPSSLRSSMLSFVSLAFQAGGMLSPLFSGFMVTKYGIHNLWTILGTALLVLTGFIGLALFRASKKSSTPI